MAWVSSQWPLTDNLLKNAASNFSEIHDGLVYGFDVAWPYLHCLKCDKSGASHCFVGSNDEPRIWICEYSCNLHQLNSFNISVSCLRMNLDGLVEAFIGNKRLIGQIIGSFFAARYLFGIPFLLAMLMPVFPGVFTSPEYASSPNKGISLFPTDANDSFCTTEVQQGMQQVSESWHVELVNSLPTDKLIKL
ncbi:hypothetical protein POM88_012662 [Heracleum sosnowskyi]|uniref:Uncharacterized protein n=1 Tax=Heracleum sosnowskyi TaxID=360622 RepID=A0AAD8IXT7_9APIA|nr:hypothetical protein POM88_012662 [Heracleum sosnowskyi]